MNELRKKLETNEKKLYDGSTEFDNLKRKLKETEEVNFIISIMFLLLLKENTILLDKVKGLFCYE
jgi:hypothetical protein